MACALSASTALTSADMPGRSSARGFGMTAESRAERVVGSRIGSTTFTAPVNSFPGKATVATFTCAPRRRSDRYLSGTAKATFTVSIRASSVMTSPARR